MSGAGCVTNRNRNGWLPATGGRSCSTASGITTVRTMPLNVTRKAPNGRPSTASPSPGGTCARQLGAVQRAYDADQRDRTRLHAVAYGTRPHSAIEEAAGARRGDDDWEQRLTDALSAFRDCRWPRDYLHPVTASGSTS